MARSIDDFSEVVIQIAEKHGFDVENDDDLMSIWRILIKDYPLYSDITDDEMFVLRDLMDSDF